jgi:hypothetical protein
MSDVLKKISMYLLAKWILKTSIQKSDHLPQHCMNLRETKFSFYKFSAPHFKFAISFNYLRVLEPNINLNIALNIKRSSNLVLKEVIDIRGGGPIIAYYGPSHTKKKNKASPLAQYLTLIP